LGERVSRRIPIATYRVQLGGEVGFAAAGALVPYLQDLGITDLYASPILKARAGSTHGYDVTDSQSLNPELGGEAPFRALCAALHDRGMGLLLDIVPNHMAASAENAWWMDVLEHGHASPWASVFDVDWHGGAAVGAGDDEDAASAAGAPGDDAIVLPVLGEPYGRVLEGGQLRLVLDPDAVLLLAYQDHRFPIEPGSWAPILRGAAGPDASAAAPAGSADPPGAAPAVPADADGAAAATLRRLLADIDALPPPGAPQRRTACESIRAALGALLESSPAAQARIEASLRHVNGTPGAPRSFDTLDALLRRQAYRLTHWRLAAEIINFRRFFDISELVGARVDLPEVFEMTHALLLEMVRHGCVAGLRVDHVDGLFDPAGYLERLQRALRGAGADGAKDGDDAPDAPGGAASAAPPFYVVVEKILTGDERLRPHWPVFGTTGYDFLDALNGLFVDPEGLRALDGIYARVMGRATRFADLLYEQKKRVISDLFGVEMRRQAAELCRLAGRDRHGRDVAARHLEHALTEVTACLPVYRTYVREAPVSIEDRQVIEAALAEARRRDPATEQQRGRREAGLDDEALDFLRRTLLLETAPDLSETEREDLRRFVMRWQQKTGPVTAKGLEDTALYQYNRLLSLNYVGSDPDPDPATLSVQAFHEHNRRMLDAWPHTLTSTSTHDSKRSEDVRARLHVLSEIPSAWERAARRWSRMNLPLRRRVAGRLVPGHNREYFLYQTLLGAWPLNEDEIDPFRERVKAYLIKASREAKVRTSWLDPDLEHEEALLEFVDALLDARANRAFLDDFLRFERRVAWPGALNSLTQLLLKIVSPGVPDFYQGTEVWNLRLVDPDNRVPVDFAAHRDMLRALRDAETAAGPDARLLCADLLRGWKDGRIKMYTLTRALAHRRARPALYQEGEYLPIGAAGPRASHLCALARRHGGDWALCAAPVRIARAAATPGAAPLGPRAWRATALTLPPGAPAAWRNVFTGETLRAQDGRTLPLASIFAAYPLALLEPAA
jgi:(1->4)-alpha-D-glucan 1-alpha-D-glucosylmutase